LSQNHKPSKFTKMKVGPTYFPKLNIRDLVKNACPLNQRMSWMHVVTITAIARASNCNRYECTTCHYVITASQEQWRPSPEYWQTNGLPSSSSRQGMQVFSHRSESDRHTRSWLRVLNPTVHGRVLPHPLQFTTHSHHVMQLEGVVK
jgi:hypothetical protein